MKRKSKRTKKHRRRPILPGRCRPSTFGAMRLNFCVRYGNRWYPHAVVTGKIYSLLCFEQKKRSLTETKDLIESGDDLSYRTVAGQVLSAREVLTSVFGMGTGGTPQPLSPENLCLVHLLVHSSAFALPFRAFRTLKTAQSQ